MGKRKRPAAQAGGDQLGQTRFMKRGMTGLKLGNHLNVGVAGGIGRARGTGGNVARTSTLPIVT